MWYVQRSNDKGEWITMMSGPHRLNIGDLRGSPGPAYGPAISADGLSMPRVCSGDLFSSLPTPGNLTVFSGKKGMQACVRYNDTITELYDWGKIPVNPADPESDTLWGWKLIEEHRIDVPFEELWPMSFIG